MKNWKDILKIFVENNQTALFPLLVYKVELPSKTLFPNDLKSSKSIIDFYSICDGGYIADFNWYKKSELMEKNTEWFKLMEGYYEDGTNPFNENYLILADDSGGAPLVWNSKTDKMSTFWFKGGDWEHLNMTFEEFMNHYLIHYEEEIEGDLWYKALEQIKEISK